jgi:hypothetical protein
MSSYRLLSRAIKFDEWSTHVTITAVRRPAPAPTGPMTDDVRIQRMLSEAPVGRHPLLEAAFAWHERRPKGHAPRLPANPSALQGPARYEAIIVTSAFAANRLARLLSTLTWAMATSNMQDQSTHQLQASVEVPVDEYHRVARALGAVWRGRWKQLGTDANSDSQHAARALCRMAILAGGTFDGNGVSIQMSTPSGLLTLTEVAGRLGLEVRAPYGRTGTTIRITADRALSWLLRC